MTRRIFKILRDLLNGVPPTCLTIEEIGIMERAFGPGWILLAEHPEELRRLLQTPLSD